MKKEEGRMEEWRRKEGRKEGRKERRKEGKKGRKASGWSLLVVLVAGSYYIAHSHRLRIGTWI
jgi:hypothetical protein